jgi:hypothetical protein
MAASREAFYCWVVGRKNKMIMEKLLVLFAMMITYIAAFPQTKLDKLITEQGKK